MDSPANESKERNQASPTLVEYATLGILATAAKDGCALTSSDVCDKMRHESFSVTQANLDEALCALEKRDLACSMVSRPHDDAPSMAQRDNMATHTRWKARFAHTPLQRSQIDTATKNKSATSRVRVHAPIAGSPLRQDICNILSTEGQGYSALDVLKQLQTQGVVASKQEVQRCLYHMQADGIAESTVYASQSRPFWRLVARANAETPASPV